jgi:serine/threonine-protein kinase
VSEADAADRLAPEVREGVVLAGRYLVGHMLGSGGMGVVVAARHLELDEMVAIKFLLPEMAQGADAISRFAREAWATSKIKSEYVARVSDVGRLDSGTPFIVMEYLEGMDLACMLRSRGPLPVEQAVEFVLQACEAIAEAHALGIVHRDLKPSNLFCVRRTDGLLAIKVLDFGISKVTRPYGQPADFRITATAATVGSPLYMSPEQMSSAKVADERADIWALGVILQELMTGRVPFYAPNLPELAIKIATELPAPLRAERDDIPKGLERVVSRCLEKERRRRYDNVAELAQALAPFAAPRAAAHAERAERVLRASGERGLTPLRDSGTSGGLGSHARLRGIRVRSWRFGGWAVLLMAALVGGLVWVALRAGLGSGLVGKSVSGTGRLTGGSAIVPDAVQGPGSARAAAGSDAESVSPGSGLRNTARPANAATPPTAAAITPAPQRPRKSAKPRRGTAVAPARKSETDDLGGRL